MLAYWRVVAGLIDWSASQIFQVAELPSTTAEGIAAASGSGGDSGGVDEPRQAMLRCLERLYRLSLSLSLYLAHPPLLSRWVCVCVCVCVAS